MALNIQAIKAAVEHGGGVHEWDTQRVIVELLAEVERLRAALKQYANHDNWGEGRYEEFHENFVWGPSGNGWEVAEQALIHS